MQFLNPYWLFALPLIALPILIHLLNQRRHKTVDWGAMQFLLAARKLNRGMARIKQLLIMASRMLVIAGLLFMVSRPLASGWVGSLTGGRPETVIVLLDRSASMQQQNLTTGESKLEMGVKQMVEAFETTGVRGPLVVIDSVNSQPVFVDEPASLLDLPVTQPLDGSADLPGLFSRALDYVSENETGRTDVWVCSDGAANDWDAESGQWLGVNSGFQQLEGVRFQLLKFAEDVAENVSVRVDRFERESSDSGDQLVVDVTLTRSKADDPPTRVPVTFTINGLRSVKEIEIENESASLLGHRIPIDSKLQSGWGHVEIPLDAQAADNQWYFSFADPMDRKTCLVTEDRKNSRALEIAAGTSLGRGPGYAVESIRPDQLANVDWQATTLLVWQAPLPSAENVLILNKFVESGRTLIFLPPESETDDEFSGVRWGNWLPKAPEGVQVDYWNNDSGLLKRTSNGDALPLDDVFVYQQRELQGGELQTLARLANGNPLLSRLRTDGGAVYFLSTYPTPTHSNLGRNGVTLFALVHRALDLAAESQGAAKLFTAGTEPAKQVSEMEWVTADAHAARFANEKDYIPPITSVRPFVSGVYRSTTNELEQYVAINRPPREVEAYTPLTNDETAALLEGLDFQIVEGELGQSRSLASEIWRVFVVLMGLALVLEAYLCLPDKPEPVVEDSALPGRMAA